MTQYAVSAQYYDLFASLARAEVEERTAAALMGLDSQAGPVLDVGAGTGRSTSLIASTLPEAEIFAIEPDPAMRAALMMRITLDEDLERRVTVLPYDILNAPLPSQISGALLSASLVHFDPCARLMLWKLLARRLVPSGRAIIEIQCETAEDIAETPLGEFAIGRAKYRASASARKIGEDRQTWRIEYVASLDGQILSRDVVSYDCWAVSNERVVKEAVSAGLIAQVHEELIVLRQAET